MSKKGIVKSTIGFLSEMKGLIKNTIAFVAAGETLGEFFPEYAKWTRFAGLIPLGLATVKKGLELLLSCCKYSKDAIKTGYQNNKDSISQGLTNCGNGLSNAISSISPTNPSQNAVMLGALGSKLGSYLCDATGQDPAMKMQATAVGGSVGFVAGLVLSDKRVSDCKDSCGRGFEHLGLSMQKQKKTKKENDASNKELPNTPTLTNKPK